MRQPNNKIKHALHLADWSYESGNEATLIAQGVPILPLEYTSNMKGNLFCPRCKTNLSRVPEAKNITANEKQPYFAHQSKYESVPCVWRSKRAEGKRYATYEEMRRAIEKEDLIVINQFLDTRPTAPKGENGVYDQTPVEDTEGPLVELPLGRHDGQVYEVPSRLKTVRAITRNFDLNLRRYFILPGNMHPIRLDGLLHNIADVTETDDVPKLYYGRIISSGAMGSSDSNIRMTRIACNRSIADFYLKATVGLSRDRGIGDDSNNRFVIVFGKITENGIGLGITNLGWGSFDLLPSQYNHLLDG